MKAIIILAATAAVILSSCQKYGMGKISGVVKEYGTNKPIEGAGVDITDVTLLKNGPSKTETNANGEFTFLHQNHAFVETRIIAGKEGYCVEGINNSEKNEIFLAPEASLKIHLVNSDPKKGNIVSFMLSGLNYSVASDTTVFQIIKGNLYPNKLMWSRDWENFSDTIIHCPGRDTVSVTFKF